MSLHKFSIPVHNFISTFSRSLMNEFCLVALPNLSCALSLPVNGHDGKYNFLELELKHTCIYNGYAYDVAQAKRYYYLLVESYKCVISQ